MATLTVSVLINACPYCEYLSNIKGQYIRIGLNYPTYLDKINEMLNAMVTYNLANDMAAATVYWDDNKAALASHDSMLIV